MPAQQLRVPTLWKKLWEARGMESIFWCPFPSLKDYTPNNNLKDKERSSKSAQGQIDQMPWQSSLRSSQFSRPAQAKKRGLLPAHHLMCQQDSAHFWVLILPLIGYGLSERKMR